MIAPIQETEQPVRSRRLRRAHWLVASTLLEPAAGPTDDGPPVPAWKAWLFTAWVVATTGVYCAHMLGVF